MPRKPVYGIPQTWTFRAGGDLGANQYLGVQLWGSQTVTAGTATANTVSAYMIGIQAPEPVDSTTGTDVRVIISGPAIARAGAAFTAGAALAFQTNTMKLVAATSATADRVIARALESASADSELVTVFITPSHILL